MLVGVEPSWTVKDREMVAVHKVMRMKPNDSAEMKRMVSMVVSKTLLIENYA
jgi:hypothetical protein